MDPRLLRYYNQELRYLREQGNEFAAEFPKIAARLTLDGVEVTDPYVERLLEGVAFLTGRVQLKLDAEFPRFTRQLIDTVYPDLLAPIPSMLVAQCEPDLADPALAAGPTLARGVVLTANRHAGSATACRFTVAQDTRLWPLRIASASGFSTGVDLPGSLLPPGVRVKGGIRLRIACTAGLKFSQLSMDTLRLYLAGAGDAKYRVYESLLAAPVGLLVGPPGGRPGAVAFLPGDNLASVGLSDSEAMLPVTMRGFAGMRLLQEYFHYAERFLFVDVRGLAGALGQLDTGEAEITLLFSRDGTGLESMVTGDLFRLHCVPATNLFEHRAERVQVGDGATRFQIVPDRVRPIDYEIYAPTRVTGFVQGGRECNFRPLFQPHRDGTGAGQAYYATVREPRLLPESTRRTGNRTSYVGSEMFISFVDGDAAPWPEELSQVAVSAICTNRDLPLLMPLGAGKTDFTADAALPIRSLRVISGPSRPASALLDDSMAWRLVDQLSANYVALFDQPPTDAARVLRSTFGLYARAADKSAAHELDGLLSIATRAVVRRMPAAGPIVFVRGIEATVTVDELAFEGRGAFLFGSILARFLARYASLNAFVETRIVASGRGEVMRWKPTNGSRPIL